MKINIQFVKLLELRGVTELKGETIAMAVKRTGGEPTNKEMVLVNQESMIYFLNKYENEKYKNELLEKAILKQQQKILELQKRLEEAGLDNLEGCANAEEIRDAEY